MRAVRCRGQTYPSVECYRKTIHRRTGITLVSLITSVGLWGNALYGRYLPPVLMSKVIVPYVDGYVSPTYDTDDVETLAALG